MGWIAVVFGLFKSFPDFVSLIKQFVLLVNQMSGNDPKTFITKLSEAMNQLKKAETLEDRQNAAKAIANSIAGMP